MEEDYLHISRMQTKYILRMNHEHKRQINASPSGRLVSIRAIFVNRDVLCMRNNRGDAHANKKYSRKKCSRSNVVYE
jgi:hypothetical protein